MAQLQNDPPAYMYDGGEQAELEAAVARAEAGGAPPPAYESSGMRLRRPREKGDEDEADLPGLDGGAAGATSSSSAPALARSASTATAAVAAEGMRKFNMWYTSSRLSTTLHRGGPETPAEYYMQSDVLALRKPNLLLRRGPAKDSPVVAFARIRFHTRHVLIGRGDCTAPGWTVSGGADGRASATQELHRDRNLFSCSDWRFTTSAGGGELTTPGADGGAGAAPATEFVWRKDMSKRLATVYACVDAGTGRVVARLLSGGGLNFNKGGEIHLAESLAQPLEELLLVSAEAIWAWEALNYQSLRQGYDADEGGKR